MGNRNATSDQDQANQVIKKFNLHEMPSRAGHYNFNVPQGQDLSALRSKFYIEGWNMKIRHSHNMGNIACTIRREKKQNLWYVIFVIILSMIAFVLYRYLKI